MLIELKNICKNYKVGKDSTVRALSDISLNFNSGLHFILGKSGSGKSTLLNIIGGLDVASSGSIIVEEDNLSNFDKRKLDAYRNYNVGFVFQEYNLLQDLDVKENIALALKMQGEKVDYSKIKKVLDIVEMSDCMDRNSKELSGGQKQRVAIARALIKNPGILLADEPTGSLDCDTSNQIMSILKKLSENHLIIVVTHDQNLARKYADRIVYLNDGKVEKIEDISDVSVLPTKKNPLHIRFLPIFSSFKMGLKYLKTNVFRLLILIILSVFSFCCLGVAITAFQYDKYDLIANSIEKNDFKDPFVISCFEKNDNTITHQTPISSMLLDEINKKYDISSFGIYQNIGKTNNNFSEEIIFDYSKTYDALSLMSLSGLSTIENIDFDKMGISVYGSYPSSEKEIMITDYFYESFKKYGYSYNDETIDSINISKEKMIGKKICVSKYVHDDLYEEYIISGVLETGIDLNNYKDLYAYNSNRIDLKKDKILISYYQKGSIFSTGFVTKDGLNRIYSYDKNNSILYDSVIGLMPHDRHKLCEIMRFLNSLSDEAHEYKLVNSTDEWIDNVDTLLSFFKRAGSISGLVLSVFSGLLLYNYISMSINHKKREIGIIRALGARGIDAFNIFSSESIFISIINSILSILGTAVLLYFINKQIRKECMIEINVYNISFITIMFIILFSLSICILSTILPIIRLSKKTPHEIIID